MSDSIGARFSILLVRPVYPFDHRSLLQPDPAEQIGVARIGADVVEIGVKFEGIQRLPCRGCSFESRESGILVAKHIHGELLKLGFDLSETTVSRLDSAVSQSSGSRQTLADFPQESP